MIKAPCLVVVPCHNEANRLVPSAFLGALDEEPALRFLFVNDGSTDDTGRVLETLREQARERIEILTLERCSGKAEAVRQGVLDAFARGAALVGYWDADLATPLNHIADFAEVLETTQIQLVLGSRVRMLGRDVERTPARHYLGRVFASVVSVGLGLPVYDSQCGAKLFRASAALRDVFAEPFTHGWTFDVELLERLLARKQRPGDFDVLTDCAEYPLRSWHDAKGSKIRPAHYARIAVDTLRILLRGLRRRGLG